MEGKGITKGISLTSPWSVGEADESFTEQLKKKAAPVMDTMGYTDEDFEKGKCLCDACDTGLNRLYISFCLSARRR